MLVRHIIQYYLDRFLYSIGERKPVDLYQRPSGAGSQGPGNKGASDREERIRVVGRYLPLQGVQRVGLLISARRPLDSHLHNRVLSKEHATPQLGSAGCVSAFTLVYMETRNGNQSTYGKQNNTRAGCVGVFQTLLNANCSIWTEASPVSSQT